MKKKYQYNLNLGIPERTTLFRPYISAVAAAFISNL